MWSRSADPASLLRQNALSSALVDVRKFLHLYSTLQSFCFCLQPTKTPHGNVPFFPSSVSLLNHSKNDPKLDENNLKQMCFCPFHPNPLKYVYNFLDPILRQTTSTAFFQLFMSRFVLTGSLIVQRNTGNVGREELLWHATYCRSPTWGPEAFKKYVYDKYTPAVACYLHKNAVVMVFQTFSLYSLINNLNGTMSDLGEWNAADLVKVSILMDRGVDPVVPLEFGSNRFCPSSVCNTGTGQQPAYKTKY